MDNGVIVAMCLKNDMIGACIIYIIYKLLIGVLTIHTLQGE